MLMDPVAVYPGSQQIHTLSVTAEANVVFRRPLHRMSEVLCTLSSGQHDEQKFRRHASSANIQHRIFGRL